MEETLVDLLSRWLGYIALAWITYLVYLASGVSITNIVTALFGPKKKQMPEIQVIPATPSTPDKEFVLLKYSEASEATPEADFVKQDVPSGQLDNNKTGIGSSSAQQRDAEDSVTSAQTMTSELCDPMCDPTTRFHVTRCSFSVEKAQTLPSIKILTPEDICPPGTLISGLPASGKDDDDDDNHENCDSNNSDKQSNLTDPPQKSNSDDGTPAERRPIGGDDLLVKMLCDIDQVDGYLDLKKPRVSVDNNLPEIDVARRHRLEQRYQHALASSTLPSLSSSSPKQQQQQQTQQHNCDQPLEQQQIVADRKHHHKKRVTPERAVRFTLPDGACTDDSLSHEDESPDSDDEDSAGSPSTYRKTKSRVTPFTNIAVDNNNDSLFSSSLKDSSDEALDDESSSRIDTDSVLDALLFQRSVSDVDFSTAGGYEMVYRDKYRRQSLGDSVLTGGSITPTKFKARLREEDFTDLLPPLSPDCGYDSLSEVVSSPDELDGSAPHLSVITEDPFEEEKNVLRRKSTNDEMTTMLTRKTNNSSSNKNNPFLESTDIADFQAKSENPSLAEDFSNLTTVRL